MSGWEGKMRSTNALCLKHRQAWLLPALHLQKEKKIKETPQNCACFWTGTLHPCRVISREGLRWGSHFTSPPDHLLLIDFFQE